MAEITLEFIGEQLRLMQEGQRSLREDVAGFREDMAVMSAIVMRTDATMSALLTEVRGVHAQISRVQQRIAKLVEPT